MRIRVFLSIAYLAILAGLGSACAGQGPASAPVGDTTPTQEPSATLPPAPSMTPAPVLTPTPIAVPAQKPASPADEATTTRRSVDLGSGNAAPELELALLNGGTLRLSDLRGKVVVLNFWASWCPPCRKEMPAFEQVWGELKEQGVVFVGIAVSDTEEDARDFAEKIGITYPLGLDTTGEISRAYRVLALPTTVFIDRQGNESRRIASAINEGVLRIILKWLLDEE